MTTDEIDKIMSDRGLSRTLCKVHNHLLHTTALATGPSRACEICTVPFRAKFAMVYMGCRICGFAICPEACVVCVSRFLSLLSRRCESVDANCERVSKATRLAREGNLAKARNFSKLHPFSKHMASLVNVTTRCKGAKFGGLKIAILLSPSTKCLDTWKKSCGVRFSSK